MLIQPFIPSFTIMKNNLDDKQYIVNQCDIIPEIVIENGLYSLTDPCTISKLLCVSNKIRLMLKRFIMNKSTERWRYIIIKNLCEIVYNEVNFKSYTAENYKKDNNGIPLLDKQYVFYNQYYNSILVNMKACLCHYSPSFQMFCPATYGLTCVYGNNDTPELASPSCLFRWDFIPFLFYSIDTTSIIDKTISNIDNNPCLINKRIA